MSGYKSIWSTEEMELYTEEEMTPRSSSSEPSMARTHSDSTLTLASTKQAEVSRDTSFAPYGNGDSRLTREGLKPGTVGLYRMQWGAHQG